MNTGIKLLFTGDIYIQNKPGKKILSEKMQNLFSEHNIISCNFEAPVGTKELRKIPKVGSHLLQPEFTSTILKEAGFNFFSLANNHIYDYGEKGLRNTMFSLQDNVISGAGMDFNSAYQLKKITIKDNVLGFLSFCESEFGALIITDENRGGYAWINHSSVNKSITDAKKECDILIVQAHTGVEEIEIPLPEWRQRYRELIDLGADIVIGHHPHVPQGWEIYNNKFIYYSLGNFYFDMHSNQKYWNNGLIVSVEVYDKKVTGVNSIPVKRINNQVEINEDQQFAEYLEYLCRILNYPEYIKLADKVVIELWNSRYKKYYTSAMNGLSESDSLFRILNIIGRRLFLKNNKNKNLLLLLHNIRIESHRWAVQRALSLLAEQ